MFGMTSSDANEVCLLEEESKGDILTSLCTPFSAFKYPYALRTAYFKCNALYSGVVTCKKVKFLYGISFAFTPQLVYIL